MNGRSPFETDVPSLRDRIRQATASAILAAAEEVFADEGLHAARMNDIAARAGVAVGTLYNHFKDRDALLADLLALRRAELLEILDRAIDAPQLEFRARLTGLMRSFFDYVGAHRPFFSIFQQGEMGRYATTFPVGGKKVPEFARELYTRLEKLVKRGVRERALRPSGAALYPSMLLSVLRGCLLRCHALDLAVETIDVDEAVRFFLDGAGAGT
jgi:AcrR family transcriptional regulator